MLPAYERNRWPATLFFGSFLALGMFFMMNLLLATVYNTYSEERAADSLKRDRNVSSTLRTPFHCSVKTHLSSPRSSTDYSNSSTSTRTSNTCPRTRRRVYLID